MNPSLPRRAYAEIPADHSEQQRSSAAVANDRFWRIADIGLTGTECPLWRKADIRCGRLGLPDILYQTI
jgi:hypothetical protein